MRHILALACGAALMLTNLPSGRAAEDEYRVNKKPQEPPPLPSKPTPSSDKGPDKTKRLWAHLQRWLRL
jgi:hypothetical protein